jgi:hypothetical protein
MTAATIGMGRLKRSIRRGASIGSQGAVTRVRRAGLPPPCETVPYGTLDTDSQPSVGTSVSVSLSPKH